MTAAISEKWSTRKGKRGLQADFELQYVITDTDDDDVAHDLLDATAPSTWGGNELDSTSIEQIASDIFIGTAKYIDPERRGEKEEQVKEIGESSLSFRTGGGSFHITQSKETVSRYSAGSFPADFQGAIGVQGDSVEGCDIVVPVMEWQEELKISLASLSGYLTTLYGLTGKTNNATFRGFAAGEVLFKGANGSRDGKVTATVTFDFAASPNVTGLSIGGSASSADGHPPITGIAKGGWEYLWVHYREYKSEAQQRIVKYPHTVIVERVYDSGDFSALGLP